MLCRIFDSSQALSAYVRATCGDVRGIGGDLIADKPGVAEAVEAAELHPLGRQVPVAELARLRDDLNASPSTVAVLFRRGQ